MHDFISVTEVSGERVSAEQVERLRSRYCWAARYCAGKNVLEVACGSGQGLGLINSSSKSLVAGDYSPVVLQTAIDYYNSRIPLKLFDAQEVPFDDNSFDVIIIFEAIYYLADVGKFFEECKRVLKPRGQILISMPNKSLSDFNPSPYSHTYFDISELTLILKAHDFESEFFGYLSVNNISVKQRLFRPIKKLAVKLGLVPKTMSGKRLLKRIVFGRLIEMPSEVKAEDCKKCKGVDLLTGTTSSHKVIYCAASLN